MNKRRYTYMTVFTGQGEGLWRIIDMGDKGHCNLASDPVVWSMAWKPEHEDLSGQPPLEVRQEYERLLAESGFDITTEQEDTNIVEFMASTAGDDIAFDQPCAHGCRVEGHAVYCHNKTWLYAPRKCRRTQGPSVWGDEPWPHQACPGFKENA